MKDRLSEIGIPRTHEDEFPTEEKVQDRIRSAGIRISQLTSLIEFREENPGKRVADQIDPSDLVE